MTTAVSQLYDKLGQPTIVSSPRFLPTLLPHEISEALRQRPSCIRATGASQLSATGASQLWFRHVSFYPLFSVMKIVRHCGSDHRAFRKMLTNCPRNERSANRDGNEVLASVLTNLCPAQLASERIANRRLAMANFPFYSRFAREESLLEPTTPVFLPHV